MPEPDNPNSNPKKPEAEISVEKRLLLAFALMGAVLVHHAILLSAITAKHAQTGETGRDTSAGSDTSPRQPTGSSTGHALGRTDRGYDIGPLHHPD